MRSFAWQSQAITPRPIGRADIVDTGTGVAVIVDMLVIITSWLLLATVVDVVHVVEVPSYLVGVVSRNWTIPLDQLSYHTAELNHCLAEVFDTLGCSTDNFVISIVGNPILRVANVVTVDIVISGRLQNLLRVAFDTRLMEIEEGPSVLSGIFDDLVPGSV